MDAWQTPDVAWNPIEGYDPASDVTLPQATARLAAMIGSVLAYRGLDPRYSHSLPPEQVPLDPDSGPVAVHVGGSAAPVPVEVYDGCIVRLQYTVKSYYFIRPIQSERADAWQDVEDWLIPILRAQFANQTLGVFVERCLPVAVEWVGEMAYGDAVFTGLIVTSHLWINYEWAQT